MNNFVDQLFSLKGQHAVVTGGNSGIGLTIATALGRAGASVLLVARREAQLAQAAAALSGEGIEVETLTLDLSKTEHLLAAGQAILQRAPQASILVNAAGINFREPFMKVTPEAWDQIGRASCRERV